MKIKIRKNYLRLPYDSVANGALPSWLTSFLQQLMTIPLGNSQRLRLNLQLQSLVFLSWVFFVHWKSIFFLLTFKEFGVNSFITTLLLHGLNPRPSLCNISAKNHLNCLQPSCSKAYFFAFSSPFLVVAIFLISGFYLTRNKYVFDHSNFPNIMSPGSLRKHPFLPVLRRWGRFAQNVLSGEERGETNVFAG